LLLNIFLVYKSSENKNLENVKLKEIEKIPKGLAIMIETEHNSDDYEESNTSSWPKTGYKFNKEKSGCIDNSGSTIENSLSYNSTTNIVTVDTEVTTKCYIYFDKRYSLEELCTSGEDTLGECLTNNNSAIESLDNTAYSGMYRYTGTQEVVDDNYICFGTTDKDTCVNNPETYMYRVIGVTSEANNTLGLETNQLKLIKSKSIGTHQWHNNVTTDTKWEDSTMYSYLQNDVLSNTTYYPRGWSSKISSIKWNIGDVQHNYVNGNLVRDYEDNSITSSKSKIGLMYLSDYYYAYNAGGLQDCRHIACTNWLTDTSNYTWTMSRFGFGNYDYYYAYTVNMSALVGGWRQSGLNAVRPVFYLNSDEQYISGDGTADDPIILSEVQLSTLGEYLLENPTLGLDTTTAYSGMYRYVGIDTTVNNYVKLENVLYRVIGITSEANDTLGILKNQVKIIKSETIGTHEWHTYYTTDTKWENSSMYTYLQGSSVLGNTNVIPSGWASKIDSVKWYIGDVNTASYINSSTVFGYEDNSITSSKSKVGLMHLSDYYYAYNAGGNYSCNTVSGCTSWLTGMSDATWTMSRYDCSDGDCDAWFVGSSGQVGLASISLSYAVRPVFYLNKDVYISNSEATGTSTDPFILAY